MGLMVPLSDKGSFEIWDKRENHIWQKNLNMNYFNNKMLLLVIHAGMKVATLKKKYISVTHVSGYVNFYCNDCHLHIRI